MFKDKTQDIPQTTSLLELFLRGKWWKAWISVPGFFGDFIAIGLSSSLINILGLALPLMMLQVYDRIVPNKSLGTLSWLVLGVIGAILLESFLRICRNIITSWISSRFDFLISKEVLSHFVNLKFKTYSLLNTGAHLERLNAVTTLRKYYSGELFQILFDIPFIPFYLWVVYLVGGPIVLFTITVIVGYIILVLWTQKSYRQNHHKVQIAKDEQLNFILESLNGIHTIKALSLEEDFLRRYEKIQKDLSVEELKLNQSNMIPNHYAPVFSQINLLGIIAIGAGSVISGDMTIGMMTAATIISARIMQPVQQLAVFLIKRADVINAKRLLTHLIIDDKEQEDMQHTSFDDIDGKIIFQDVTFGKDILNSPITDVNLLIKKGESVAIISDSPQEAELLAHLICGLEAPDAGSIFIDEFNMSKWEHGDFNGRVQYLPQEGHLFHGTIMENLTLFNSEKELAALTIARILKLDHLIAELPQGYHTNVGLGTKSTFSYSIIQRLCIARALVIRPRILILNRTLLGLDTESQKIVVEALKIIQGKCTIICIGNTSKSIGNTDSTLLAVNKKIILSQGRIRIQDTERNIEAQHE